MRIDIVLVTTLAIAAAGCSAENSRRYLHPSLGVVSFQHPEFVRTQQSCAQTAFAKGIEINGRTVTEQKEARAAYLADMFNLNMASTERRPEHMAKPPYAARFKTLEAETEACVKAAGFEKTVL